jgi:AraC-like DNA-binding protein
MLLAGFSAHLSPDGRIWPAGLVVWGPAMRSSPHAHHALQIVLALEGHLRARKSAPQRWRRVGAVVVQPDAVHEIDCSTAPGVLIAFIEPESGLGAAVSEQTRRPITFVPAPIVSGWRRTLKAPSLVSDATVRRWFASAFSMKRPPRLDDRVAHVIRVLRDRESLGRVPLVQVAALAHLSPSRFAHLFTTSVGIPLRRYVLWLRLQRAAGALLSGHTITSATYGAGFSDAAHLSRTFRRMLGTSPREIVHRQASSRGLRVPR